MGGLCTWIYNLFANCFRRAPAPPPPPPPPPPPLGYGFAWQPNTLFANLQVAPIPPNCGNGLYVMFPQACVDNPGTFFENNGMQLGIIFPLQAASVAFTQAMQGITNDANLMQRLEGFLRYTYYCLNYIYATQPGQTLLDNLRNGQRRVWIQPSHIHNENAGGSFCFIARVVINSNMNISQAEQLELVQLLEQTSAQQGANAYQWLAAQINQMSLYSMYEQSNAYPATFLQTNNIPVTQVGLQQWFTTGSNSQFIQNLQQVNAVAGVKILNFVKNAVIVSLYVNAVHGPGSDSYISFDVRDWSNNNVGEDQDINTMQDRPPAIGLAHELIHAYYNGIGGQPGSNFGSFTTTLFELLCVGMGPWANNPVSENRIRQAWPPNNVWPAAGDALNNRAVAQRTVYVAPGPQQQPADLRDGATGGNGPI